MRNQGFSSCLHFYIVVSVVIYITSFCEAINTKKPEAKELYPVIYVPGFAGSQLDATVNSNWLSRHSCRVENLTSKVWLDYITILDLLKSEYVENSDAKCVIDQMRLIYDPHSHKTSDVPGVQINVFGWGDPSAVKSFFRPSPVGGGLIIRKIGQILDLEIVKYWLENKEETKFLKYLESVLKLLENGLELFESGLRLVGTEIVHRIKSIFYGKIKNSLEVAKKLINLPLYLNTYFNDVTEALEYIGLKSNISIRSAPYDFRKAPNEQKHYFQNLKNLVEETYLLNHNTPVVLVVHSMGGPMTLHFLHTQSKKWKDKYIKSLVSLSGAWGGSVKAVKTFIEGDIDMPFFSSKTIKKVLSTFPSLAWLLPSPNFWSKNEILVTTPTKIYRRKDMKKLLLDINQTVAWEMYKDVLKYKLDFRPPGVEVHCLYGIGVDTLEQLHYNGTLGQAPEHIVTKDGDGTLSLKSLQGCLRWENRQKENVYHQNFSGVKHLDIVKNERVIDYIKSVVNGSASLNHK